MRRPSVFDPADFLDHHLVVIAVRAAMQRKREAAHRFLARGKQYSIAAKIVEPDAIDP